MSTSLTGPDIIFFILKSSLIFNSTCYAESQLLFICFELGIHFPDQGSTLFKNSLKFFLPIFYFLDQRFDLCPNIWPDKNGNSEKKPFHKGKTCIQNRNSFSIGLEVPSFFVCFDMIWSCGLCSNSMFIHKCQKFGFGQFFWRVGLGLCVAELFYPNLLSLLYKREKLIFSVLKGIYFKPA